MQISAANLFVAAQQPAQQTAKPAAAAGSGGFEPITFKSAATAVKGIAQAAAPASVTGGAAALGSLLNMLV
jgi:hypothetical protein